MSAVEDNRDASPVEADYGFAERGSETTRIETFVDAAFAFALTLLVVSFEIGRAHV